jgi:hypothetical protein
MKQFKAEEWSDFPNNPASGEPQRMMRKNLGTGGERHMEAAALRQKVGRLAAVEGRYQPAAESVCTVKAAFAANGLAPNRPEMGVLVELLFDSFSQPALAGTRSASARLRQLLYRAEPYQIDLQIEVQPGGNRLVVGGQLLDMRDPEILGSDVQVALSNLRGNVVNTMTNQFGEFRGEVENSGDLEISFPGRGGDPIVILLRGALKH